MDSVVCANHTPTTAESWVKTENFVHFRVGWNGLWMLNIFCLGSETESSHWESDLRYRVGGLVEWSHISCRQPLICMNCARASCHGAAKYHLTTPQGATVWQPCVERHHVEAWLSSVMVYLCGMNCTSRTHSESPKLLPWSLQLTVAHEILWK